jgi:pimeloyl-ACP methyl ester carboxylesterase
MPTLKPFEPLRFEDVPEHPRLPHPWARCVTSQIRITTTELGSCDVTYRTYGEGPPLLLVHGLMTAGYSFRYVLDGLGAHFRLIIPDLPGAGDSSMPEAPLTPGALACALVALVDALGVRGAPVIGNSMGGYLCMQAALLDETLFSHIVNLHSPGVPTGRMRALWAAMRALPSRAILDRLVARDPERWVHRNVHYWDETLKSREEHRVFAAPLRTAAGRRCFYSNLRDTLDARAMSAFVAALRARPLPTPLTLVYAQRDPVVPPEVGQALRRLVPAAAFIELAEASHFAHVDAADRFVAAVLPTLRAATGR